MMDGADTLRVSDAEYRIFCDLLRGSCGLHFDAATRFLVEKRLARRIGETDHGSFASYLYELRNGARSEEELSTIIDLLTTNETYFFRERSQLNALVQEVIPEMLSRPGRANRPISIWSAGCSSGEEPFSIVMLGLDAGLKSGRDFRVYASDISRSMLAKARHGVYREASFRETETALRSRHFSQKDGLTRIADSVKREVDFIHLNLLDKTKVCVARHDGRDPVSQRDHLLRPGDEETGGRDLPREAEPGWLPAPRAFRIPRQPVLGLRAEASRTRSRLSATGAGRGARESMVGRAELRDREGPTSGVVSMMRRKPIRVLVIDDSARSRKTITHMLEASPLIEVVGGAGDGQEALRRTLELEPDLITLDLEMPRMDGFTFLRLVMAKRPTPVLVISAESGEDNVFKALDLGAVDFIAKPRSGAISEFRSIEESLIRKVHGMRELRIEKVRERLQGTPPVVPAQPGGADGEASTVVIGSSTGGAGGAHADPRRLHRGSLLRLPRGSAHAGGLYPRLRREARPHDALSRVRQAAGGEVPEPGSVLVAPGGSHLELERVGSRLETRLLSHAEGVDRYVPSIDRLFASAAKEVAGSLLAIVLTGMGDDGREGASQVKAAGGRVIAESEETAVIYGMPKQVANAGLADRVLPLGKIPAAIQRELGLARRGRFE